MAIDFDVDFNPTGDNESKLTSQLGFMVRNGNIVSLTYVDWTEVPIDVLESIWADVKVKAYLLNCSFILLIELMI